MSLKRNYLVWVTVGASLLLACGGAFVLSTRAAEASFPGNNGLLAFSAPSADGSSEIFTSKLDGSSLKQRTNAEGVSVGPNWSPDGTKIAFYSNRDGHDLEIFVKDITTGKTSQLTDNFNNPGSSFPTPDSEPAWSPDGTKIAFVRTIGGDFSDDRCQRIFVMDADGSDEKLLPTRSCSTHEPVWSPDGTKIAYVDGDPFRDNQDIWVMNPDGSGQRNLTNTYDYNESGVDWSPNGRKIVYDRNTVWLEDADIWKMNPDGTHKDRLTFSPENEFAPIWSPNGRKIIFHKGDFVNSSVVMMNVDGTNKTKVSGLSSTVYAAWQPIPTP